MARHILSLSQKFSHYYLRSNSITHNKHENALQNHNFKSPHDNSLVPCSNPYHSILAYSVWQALIRTRGWRKKTRPSFNLRQTISPSHSCDNKILTVLAFSTRLKMTPSANKAFPASTNKLGRRLVSLRNSWSHLAEGFSENLPQMAEKVDVAQSPAFKQQLAENRWKTEAEEKTSKPTRKMGLSSAVRLFWSTHRPVQSFTPRTDRHFVLEAQFL